MSKLIDTYSLDGELHTIELRPDRRGGQELVDRAPDGSGVLVAELAYDEGEDQARAVLHGEGAYLERALAGERGLGQRLQARGEPARSAPRARAA